MGQNGLRQRTFVYNSLSQLTSATNPESGTISYTYDSDGNVLTKVTPAPNQTGLEQQLRRLQQHLHKVLREISLVGERVKLVLRRSGS